MSQWRVAALRSPQPDHCRADRESLSVDPPAFSPWTCINCFAGSHDSSLNLNGVTTLNMADNEVRTTVTGRATQSGRQGVHRDGSNSGRR
jgi:hypothetical protein